MPCRTCGTTTGIGNTNITQTPSNTGNAPTINTFGQRSELRPAEYWNGKLMHERYSSVQRKPSGYWPKPDRSCNCDLAIRSFQQVDTPTPASQVRSIVLPEPFDCRGRLCTGRNASQQRIRSMSGFRSNNPRRTIPLAELPEIDASNATLLFGAPLVAQRCPLKGDILYFNGNAWCLTQLKTLVKHYVDESINERLDQLEELEEDCETDIEEDDSDNDAGSSTFFDE